MTLEEFRHSLRFDHPPKELPLPLAALWWDANGDWSKAHECAQKDKGSFGAWVHAYLHRKEGDLGNAGYWYQHASRPAQRGTLEEEWNEIAKALLEKT